MRLIILMMFIVTYSNAQIVIGKNSVSSETVSIEFGPGNRGIILPWVTSASSLSGAVNGTFIYDISDKKVKIKYATGWKDLSVDSTGIVNTILQDQYNESSTSKVAIGLLTQTSGILVLEDFNKVMILPKVVSPHLNIINPAAGMMAYDSVTKQLAVFNGSVWSFWKP